MIRQLTPEEDARLLSQEQVDALAEGTRVMIKWSGGNGPHEYRVKNFHGLAHTLDESPAGSQLMHPITFVSNQPGSPLTRVFLA